MGAYVCGIDIGTSGVKVVILRKDGFVSVKTSVDLPAPIVNGNEVFQNANIWWKAVSNAVSKAVGLLRNAGGGPNEISAICIDATSGTIVPVDDSYEPVYVGIMYNDCRTYDEIEMLNEYGRDCISRLGYRFNTSFALPKILYLKNKCPEVWDKTKYILHQADFIVRKFMGKTGDVLTDTSNALKTGYDILESRWPEYIKKLGISEKLPGVVSVGSVIGKVDIEIAREFCFSDNVKIVSGMTDSVAGCIASGARDEGDMNTTLGAITTWKVISNEVVTDIGGRVYSHLHPSGCFLPGGVGNSGGDAIKMMLNATPKELVNYSNTVNLGEPSKHFAYPIGNRGERFPFINNTFKPFFTSDELEGVEFYKILLEGCACIERWGYETLNTIGAPTYGALWSTGNGAMVDSWMKIRSNILNKVIYRARFPESSYGAALIAAMRLWFNGDFVQAANNFILEEARFEPEPRLVRLYDEYYQEFKKITLEKI